MRLSAHQRQVLTQTARDCFDPDARVRLFGLRTDDTRESADIDLLIETRLQAPGQIALWSWPAGECLPEVMVVARHDSLAGLALTNSKVLDPCRSQPAGECSPAVMVVVRHDSLAGKLLQRQNTCPLSETAFRRIFA